MSPMRDGRTDGRQTREDRATQPMDAGWLSFAKSESDKELFSCKGRPPRQAGLAQPGGKSRC